MAAAIANCEKGEIIAPWALIKLESVPELQRIKQRLRGASRCNTLLKT
jgi:hypothetical protein